MQNLGDDKAAKLFGNSFPKNIIVNPQGITTYYSEGAGENKYMDIDEQLKRELKTELEEIKFMYKKKRLINPTNMKKTALLFSISLLLNCTYLLAQTNPETPLYPNGIEKNPISHPNPETVVDSVINPLSLSHKNRVISNISIPTYQLFPASEANNKHIGVVIFPGGGLVNNWVDKEGTDIAIWLSGQGINCMVMKYRTNRKDEKGEMIIPMDDYKGAIYQDARTGILKMKELADKPKNRPRQNRNYGLFGWWLVKRTHRHQIYRSQRPNRLETGFCGFNLSRKYAQQLQKN